MDTSTWHELCRRVTAFILLRTWLLSYGELVLRPVTIAERTTVQKLAPSTGQNKT